MACPVTVGVPAWAALSVLVLLFRQDRAWRAVWWGWLAIQVAGWWGRAAVPDHQAAARLALEAVFVAGVLAGAARAWYLLTIERLPLPGSRGFRRLMGLSGHDLLRDPVAAVLKGALLGLVLRELVLARPVDGVVYAVPAVSLLAWLVLLVVRGRRLRAPTVSRPWFAAILGLATAVGAAGGLPGPRELGLSLLAVAVLILLLVALKWSALQLQLWNERLLAWPRFPAAWKRARLRALQGLAAGGGAHTCPYPHGEHR